jgi:hypothetical protein
VKKARKVDPIKKAEQVLVSAEKLCAALAKKVVTAETRKAKAKSRLETLKAKVATKATKPALKVVASKAA